jgi:hypothetical protein
MSEKKRDHQWERVRRTPVPKAELARRNKNDSTLKSGAFKDACLRVGLVPPTRRQASKWNRKTGRAWSQGRD